MTAFPNAVGPASSPTQFLTPSGFLQTYAATADPTSANDGSQGFGPGSEWLNLANGRLWTCAINTVGAAMWAFSGVATSLGGEPSGITTQFGSGTNFFPEEGNVYRNTIWPGTSPAGTGSQYVLDALALSANSFDKALRGLQITGAGSFAANGDSKTLQLVASNTAQVPGQVVASAPTVIATTGAVTTNGGGWEIAANLFKYGSSGSNTQVALHSQAQVGAAVSGLQAPVQLTLNEGAIIYLALTAQTTTATDVVENWFEINAMN
jgi:hypothetical protein